MLGSPPRSKNTYSTQRSTMAEDGEEAAVQGWSQEKASSHMPGSPPRSKSTYSTQLFTMAGDGEEAAVRGGVRKGTAYQEYIQ